LEVLDEMKKDDRKKLEQLMHSEVLKSAEFPEAVYESKKVVVEKLGRDLVLAHISGELSLRGATQPQLVDARVNDMGDRLRISGEFALSQSAYGIKPVSFAGGAMRLKDELKFKFEFIAEKQQ
jgi:polyisoprenoid-binding protein YceI